MRDEDIGALVQQWRQERARGVRELAKSIQVHHTMLSRLESGQRRLGLELAQRLDRELATVGDLAAAVTQIQTSNGHGSTNGNGATHGNGAAVVPA